MKIHIVFALLVSHALADQASCPTITTHSLCPTCPVNACLRLSTITVPCDCTGAPVPTTTVSHPCNTETCFAPDCAGTSYAFVTPSSCQPTPTAAVCPTLTTSIRPPGCTPPPPPGASFCAEQACLKLETMTWPCSCVGQPVPTATVTDCVCRKGCETSTQVLYLPCPTSLPPHPTPTDGPGCPA
ncbi:hypothetical protein NKR19_g7502 [Coniochaeta hoffmannii]|uniref:Uncharacterized protein n=1 Tax=Coniochaeta hoffmannii TaxID=91930 RepID=A0AA38R771_9PEZI|nr:hypothetical protein NKR19_g7502 [Coniochaeta hoffmannii]